MKLTTFIIILVCLTSCGQDKKANSNLIPSSEKVKDTIIIKKQNALNTSYQAGFYSKSFSYYWIADKDTLDFSLNAVQYKEDYTLHISVSHKKPILFTQLLDHINKSFPLIQSDFDVTKLNTIYIQSPIYYPDLTKKLSSEYEKMYGSKSVSYENLHKFLLASSLNEEMDNFLNPLNKKVKRYGIEKFHIMKKEHFGNYIEDVDLSAYPEFTIHGMGISIQLENKEH